MFKVRVLRIFFCIWLLGVIFLESEPVALSEKIQSLYEGCKSYLSFKEHNYKVIVEKVRKLITRTPSAVVDNSSLGNLSFKGYLSGAYRTAAQVKGEVNGTPSGTTVPGRLTFATTNASGTSTERMRIQADGRVGINTVSPNSKVTIEGDSAAGADSVVHIGASATSLNTLVTSAAHSLQIDGNLYLGGTTNIPFSTTTKGKLYFSSNTAYTPLSTGVVIPFNADIDPGGNCTTGSSAGFTAPVTGYYVVTLQVISTAGVVNISTVDIRLIKNDTRNAGANVIRSIESANANFAFATTVAGVVILNQGDVVRATLTPYRSTGAFLAGSVTLLSGVNGTSLSFHLLTTDGTT